MKIKTWQDVEYWSLIRMGSLKWKNGHIHPQWLWCYLTAVNAFWSNNLVFMNSFLSDLFSMLSNTLKIPAV